MTDFQSSSSADDEMQSFEWDSGSGAGQILHSEVYRRRVSNQRRHFDLRHGGWVSCEILISLRAIWSFYE